MTQLPIKRLVTEAAQAAALAAYARLSGVQAVVSTGGTLVAGAHNPVDASSGNRTVTLADAPSAGLMVAVSKKDSSANTVTVSVTHLRDTGAGTIVLVGQYEALLLTSKADGSWWPVGDHKTKAYLDATYARQGAQGRTDLALAAVASSGLKADVGLDNVDNTSDVNKPVSTAQTTAIAAAIAPQQAAVAGLTSVFATSAYYAPRGTRSTTTANANLLSIVPMLIPKAVTLTRIAVEVTTLAAASTVRLGIYNISATGIPTTLVLDAGTIDSTTVGQKEITISQALSAGYYGLAALAQGGSPICRGIFGGGALDVGSATLAGALQTTPMSGWYQSGVVAAALPSTFTMTDRTAGPVLVAVRS